MFDIRENGCIAYCMLINITKVYKWDLELFNSVAFIIYLFGGQPI